MEEDKGFSLSAKDIVMPGLGAMLGGLRSLFGRKKRRQQKMQRAYSLGSSPFTGTIIQKGEEDPDMLSDTLAGGFKGYEFAEGLKEAKEKRELAKLIKGMLEQGQQVTPFSANLGANPSPMGLDYSQLGSMPQSPGMIGIDYTQIGATPRIPSPMMGIDYRKLGL